MFRHAVAIIPLIKLYSVLCSLRGAIPVKLIGHFRNLKSQHFLLCEITMTTPPALWSNRVSLLLHSNISIFLLWWKCSKIDRQISRHWGSTPNVSNIFEHHSFFASYEHTRENEHSCCLVWMYALDTIHYKLTNDEIGTPECKATNITMAGKEKCYFI